MIGLNRLSGPLAEDHLGGAAKMIEDRQWSAWALRVGLDQEPGPGVGVGFHGRLIDPEGVYGASPVNDTAEAPRTISSPRTKRLTSVQDGSGPSRITA